jgi:transcriptional regulator with PAS, ATPase and Fis domain
VFFGAPAPEPLERDLPAESPTSEVSASLSLDDRLHEVEANLISWALKISGGNKSKAAELLQIKRSTPGDRIARSGLSPAPPLNPPLPLHAWRSS